MGSSPKGFMHDFCYSLLFHFQSASICDSSKLEEVIMVVVIISCHIRIYGFCV